MAFADERGIHADNPLCDSDMPSRRQLGMRDEAIGGTFFYKCARDGCGFWTGAEPSDPIKVMPGEHVRRLVLEGYI